MTRRECNQARVLLAGRVDRTETNGADTEGGLALTAYWRDGSGQKIFWTLDEVTRHVGRGEDEALK